MSGQMLMQKLSTEFSQLIQSVLKSLVLVQGRRIPSTGIVWRKNLVVTADHSLPRVEEVQIQTASGDMISARIAGRDPSLDVAFLHSASDLEPAQINSDAGMVAAGQLMMIAGRAAGGRPLAILTMVSGAGGQYRNWRGGAFDQFIRLDTGPFPGLSGSALVLPEGKVVGMNTSVFSRHFGLTVPASNIERIVQRLATKGTIGKPYIGIMAQQVRLPDQIKQKTGAANGLLLIATEAGSPAEAAGLMIGDVLIRINGKDVTSIDQIFSLLSQETIGNEVNLNLIRGGAIHEALIKIGERELRR